MCAVSNAGGMEFYKGWHAVCGGSRNSWPEHVCPLPTNLGTPALQKGDANVQRWGARASGCRLKATRATGGAKQMEFYFMCDLILSNVMCTS